MLGRVEIYEEVDGLIERHTRMPFYHPCYWTETVSATEAMITSESLFVEVCVQTCTLVASAAGAIDAAIGVLFCWTNANRAQESHWVCFEFRFDELDFIIETIVVAVN